MIAFIAPYPETENEKDGMLQRIKEIDKIFAKHKRPVKTATSEQILV